MSDETTFECMGCGGEVAQSDMVMDALSRWVWCSRDCYAANGRVALRRRAQELEQQRDELAALVKHAATESACVDHDDPGCFWCQAPAGKAHKKTCEAGNALKRVEES